MKFELNEDQTKRYKEWAKKVCLPDDQIGAIGGEFTFSFTPTSIGIVVKVHHANGDELDLSDYHRW